MMGLKNSPYHSCKAVTWAKCIAMGDRLDSNNPFVWDKVVLNLLGSEEYDRHISWVFKQRVDGLLASDLFIYVDAGRPIGPTEDLCWEASRRWVSTCSWLGIKVTSRKVQPPLQAPRTWYGSVTNTEGGVHGLVSQEIWDKTRRLIAELVGMERGGRYEMYRDRMESIIGFLVYVSRTYIDMTPYLKGVNLTLDIWIPYRDEEVWILQGETLKMAEVEGKWERIEEAEKPTLVMGFPHLKCDLLALGRLT